MYLREGGKIAQHHLFYFNSPTGVPWKDFKTREKKIDTDGTFITELWLTSVLILSISPSWIAWDFPVVPFSILTGAEEVLKSHWSLLIASCFSLPPSPSSHLRGRTLRSRGRIGYIFRSTLQYFQLPFPGNCGYWKAPTSSFKQLGELGGLRISMISLSLLSFLVFLCAVSALMYTYVWIYCGNHDGSKGEGRLIQRCTKL